MESTSELVIKALAITLKLNDMNIQENHLLKEDLGLDSMSSLTFLMQLEDMIPGFIVNPDTLDTESLSTVSTITHYVENQLRQIA